MILERPIQLAYHLMRPLIDLKLTLTGIGGYPAYIHDLMIYQRLEVKLKTRLLDLCPKLHDKTTLTPVDHHYFYQQIWVFKHVLKQRPPCHLDTGSTYELSAYLAQLVPTTFIDLRPIQVNIPHLKVIRADILNLSMEDSSWESISCLHVVEHIGLGRYGDKLDAGGTQKACQELARILKPAGRLYFSVPIGHERVCFNAHRVFHPQTILKYFNGLHLIGFSVVDDKGQFTENVDYRNFGNLDYGCGLFLFEKPVSS